MVIYTEQFVISASSLVVQVPGLVVLVPAPEDNRITHLRAGVMPTSSGTNPTQVIIVS